VDPTRERRRTGHRQVRGEVAVLPADSELDAFVAPADLPAYAREVWDIVVTDLVGTGRLYKSDVLMVKAFCEAAYVHAEASANIHRFGLNVKTVDGRIITNPMLRVQKDAATTMRQVSDVLGLNPLARVRAGLMEAAGITMVNELRERLVAKLAANT
jgi:P27 family predicted phage terminase small subunit